MPALQPPERFLVAFSYAGEQVDIVRPMAVEAAAQLGERNVFFAGWWEHYLAGSDADLKLQEIYATAAVVVVCVSERYGAKAWTTTEFSVVRARLMKAQAAGAPRDKLGVLPVRVGDGDVAGLPFNAIVPDIRGRSARDAARLVLDRLSLTGATSHGIDLGVRGGYRTHLVGRGDTIDAIAARYLGAPSEWRRLALANGIVDPLAIVPGQRLLIPHLETDRA